MQLGQSLLGSLIKNSTTSRSNSLFSKSFTANSHERAKSYSQHRDESLGGKKNHKLSPLCQAVHLLSVKIKKLNYFFFCRLQSNMKDKRVIQSMNVIQSLICKQNTKIPFLKTIQQASTKLKQFIDIRKTKTMNQFSLQNNKLKFIQKIIKSVEQIIKNKQKQLFNKLYHYNLTYLKLDVIFHCLNNIHLNFLRHHFLHINLYSRSLPSFSESMFIEYETKPLQNSQTNSNLILQSIQEQQSQCQSQQVISLSPFYPNSSQCIKQNKQIDIEIEQYQSPLQAPISYRSNKTYNKNTDNNLLIKLKKYVIKKSDNLKITIKVQQPRKIPNICKAIKQMTKFEKELNMNTFIWLKNGNQSITKLNRLHPQTMVMKMPQLNDNLIFDQLPISLDNYSNYKIEDEQWLSDDSKIKFQTFHNGFKYVQPFTNQNQTSKLQQLKYSSNGNNIIKDRMKFNKTTKDNKNGRFGQIDKMMNDLQMIKQKSFIACLTEESPNKYQYDSNKNKVIVNISSKKFVNSAKKDEISVNHTKSINYNSDRKKKKREKENIQVKLFEAKDKLSMQPKQSDRKHLGNKKNSGPPIVSTLNAGQFNRFMTQMKKYRPEIDAPNSHKSKNSIHNFKLVLDQKI